MARSEASHLYLLGDIFNLWIGWKHLRHGEYQEIIAALRDLTGSGVAVFFVPGNHDFLVGRAFVRATGVKMMYYGGVVEMDAKRVYVSHGDYLCAMDKNSRRFIAVVRGFFGRCVIQPLFKTLPARTIFNLTGGFMGHSDRVKKHKKSNYFEIDLRAIRRIFARKVDFIIAGHIHRRQKRDFLLRGAPKTLYTLDRWHNNADYLEFSDGEFSQKSFD